MRHAAVMEVREGSLGRGQLGEWPEDGQSDALSAERSARSGVALAANLSGARLQGSERALRRVVGRRPIPA